MTSLSDLFVDLAGLWNSWSPLVASTLLHFLWQGAVLGLAAVAILRLVKLAPVTRYAVGVVTLAMMLAAPAATLVVLSERQSATAVSKPSAHVSVALPSLAGASVAGRVVQTNDAVVTGDRVDAIPAVPPVVPATGRASLEPVIVGIWFIGVCALSIRLLGGWIVARRLSRRSVRPVGPELESLARCIAGRLALDRVVRIAQSPAVAVPVLVGWLKPVVLLPASALSGLTPTQVEALLAHELAHVRRHDYVVNLLQSVVETLLFYHPAVWWVSREVRREREHCCDDVAVSVCDRVEYVTALANLAAMTSVPRTALAATDGSLVGRVRRLLVPGSDDHRSTSVGWMAVSAVVLGVVLAGVSVSSAVPAAGPLDQSAPPAVPAVAPPALAPRVETPAARLAVPKVPDVPGAPRSPVEAPVASTQNPPPPPPPPPPARVQPVPPTPPPPGVPPAPPAPRAVVAEQASEQAAREMERAMRDIQRQMMEAQREIEMKRLELELQRAELETQLQLEMAKSQIELLAQQMSQVKEKVSTGLATREALAEVERQMAEARQHLRMAEAEMQMRKADIDLRRRETETRAQYERRLLELEMAQIEAERASTADVARAREAAVAAAVRAGRAPVEAVAPRPGRQMEVVLPETTEPVPENEPARAGDVVRIQIAGEPELPRNYEVSGDGSIRMPFMGAIRVQGLTASQIREELTRQLAARGLKANASVTVSIRR